MKGIEEVVCEKLNTITSRGERILENGTRLISPAPKIAPQAWHYVLFAPLSVTTIEAIERELSTPFPNDLRSFFQSWNGLKLFGYQMQVWGKRNRYVRVGDEAWQPFDLVALNQASERPTGSPGSVVFFGSLYDDWIFFERTGDGKTRIGRTGRKFFHPEEYWPSFDTWFEKSFHNFWNQYEVAFSN